MLIYKSTDLHASSSQKLIADQFDVVRVVGKSRYYRNPVLNGCFAKCFTRLCTACQVKSNVQGLKYILVRKL